MATRATNGGTSDGGRMARWTRRGSPLWGSATGLLRALILVVIFYATILYVIVTIGGYASLDDERLERSAEVAMNLAPFLVTGMALLAVAVFVSMRVAALMSGIMLVLGVLTALLPGKDSASLLLALFSEDEGVPTDGSVSRFVDLVMLAGPPAITLGLSLAVLWVYRTHWHNEQSGPMPRELIWAAGIGIGYGWFYASVASPFGMYPLVALASLLMLRGLQRFAVWIAVLAVIVSVTGLITAIVEGPPERLFHRLPWAIAVLCMVPLARRGRRELDSRSSPPSPNDGVAPNPQDSPATTSARVEPVSAHDPGPAQEGPHDASIPTALSGSGKTEGDPPVVAELSWVADQKKPAAPARNNPPPPAENPLRWFARPDRYRRPGDRPGETRVDAGQG